MVRVGETWTGWSEDSKQTGGALFTQRCPKAGVVITTGMLAPAQEEWNRPPSADEHRRPIGFITSRLFDIRYPDDHDDYSRNNWDRWAKRVWAERDAYVKDDARFSRAAVEVDGTQYDGVGTRIDERFLAGAFELPEGWLHIGVERTRARARDLEFDQVHLARSTDLDRVAWRRGE